MTWCSRGGGVTGELWGFRLGRLGNLREDLGNHPRKGCWIEDLWRKVSLPETTTCGWKKPKKTDDFLWVKKQRTKENHNKQATKNNKQACCRAGMLLESLYLALPRVWLWTYHMPPRMTSWHDIPSSKAATAPPCEKPTAPTALIARTFGKVALMAS